MQVGIYAAMVCQPDGYKKLLAQGKQPLVCCALYDPLNISHVSVRDGSKLMSSASEVEGCKFLSVPALSAGRRYRMTPTSWLVHKAAIAWL